MIARLSGPYAIVDVSPERPPARALEVLEALLAGGIGVVQLRAKALGARDLAALGRRCRERTRAQGAVLVINDRPDVALLVEADGVHLGQEDLAIEDVRGWLPPTMAIGVSCHDLDQLGRAIGAGAAYVGYGPVFPTRSKARPDPVVGIAGLRAACARAGHTPVVAIGGIGVEALPQVRAAGASAAAMIAALAGAADPAQAAQRAREAWGA